jgi:plastocyanin
MRKSLFMAITVAISLGFGVLLISNPTSATAEQGKAPPMEVKVDNFSFTPETLTVPLNTTVTWINLDDVPHVIASNNGLFKSKGLDTDDKYSFTFTQAGTYAYYCGIHPKMTGKIVVQ